MRPFERALRILSAPRRGSRGPEAVRENGRARISARAVVFSIGGAIVLAIGGAIVGCASPGDGPESTERTPSDARAPRATIAPHALADGWQAFLDGLEDGRRALEEPAFLPPPPTDRNLAEGYRYLLGHLARIIEAETQQHPDFPSFQRSVRMLSKWTIDNPDTMYLSAAIDVDGIYRIRGRARDTRHWRSARGAHDGPRAPHVVIFQTATARIGETGDLAELRSCRNQTLDAIDQFALEPDAEGRFELIVAARRPVGWDGPFLASRGEAPCPTPFGTTTYRMRDATQLNVREIFSDWDSEVPLDLEIVRLDLRGMPRPVRTPAEMGLHLRQIGRRVANQIAFWNRLHALGLEVYGDRNGDGRRALPLNALNPPSPPFIAGGTAGAGQLYSAGVAELADDEALVVRIEAPIEPHYLGFQLANLWGESLDQANYVSSQTGHQNPIASDGARHYVISARDPGTPGWLSTTGLPKLTMSVRFIFAEPPARERMPTITSVVVPLEGVREYLPPDTPEVTPEIRRRQVDARQRHIQRRWRQY